MKTRRGQTTYIFAGEQNTKKFIRRRSDKKVLTVNLAVRYNTGFLSNYSGFQTLCLNLGICYQKSRNNLVTKNLLHQHRAVFCFSLACQSHVLVYHWYAIRMYSYVIPMLPVCHSYVLATEIFKARNNLSPPIVQNIFRTIEPAYSLRRDTIFESHRIQTQRYGIESLTYLGPKIWSQVPSEIKESHSLAVFKNKIKNWRPKLCPCKLCKTYVVNLGYL